MQPVTETVNPDEYNGWINYETWATALHLSNDQDLYLVCTEIAEAADNIYAAAHQLEQWINEEVEAIYFTDDSRYNEPAPKWVRMMASDVGSFHRVDWVAVAESFAE